MSAMKNRVYVFGEILYDIFGSERKLGGAPLNFGCHFASLGGDAVMISAVGRDAQGIDALAEARSYGVDTSRVAFSRKPTGYCLVTLKDGAPSYELVYPVAYDYIRFKELPPDAQGVYFGTLAQRGEVSRRSLWQLLEITRAKAFFDINIRQNFYTKSIIDRSLKRCDVLKVSREESGIFKALGLCKYEKCEDISKYLADKYSIGTVVVTLDKDGAFVYEAASGKIFYSRKPKSKPVSTVGAGDSFSAAFFHGTLGGLTAEECLDRAITLSDYVVTVVGAVCRYPEELKQRLGI